MVRSGRCSFECFQGKPITLRIAAVTNVYARSGKSFWSETYSFREEFASGRIKIGHSKHKLRGIIAKLAGAASM